MLSVSLNPDVSQQMSRNSFHTNMFDVLEHSKFLSAMEDDFDDSSSTTSSHRASGDPRDILTSEEVQKIKNSLTPHLGDLVSKPTSPALTSYAEEFRKRVQDSRKKSSVVAPADDPAQREKLKLLAQMETLMATMREQRTEYQESASRSMSQSTTSSVTDENNTSVYAHLDEDELKLVSDFLDETQQLSAIVKKRYLRDTASSSWANLLTSPVVEEFCDVFYERLCANLPYVPEYIKKLKGEDKVIAHYINVITTTLELYENPHVMIDELPRIAARHRGFGVSADSFFIMRNIFMELLPEYMDFKVYEQSKKDWLRFWNLVLDLMVAGSRSKEGETYNEAFQKNNQKALLLLLKKLEDKQSPNTPHFISVAFQRAADDDPRFKKSAENFSKFRNAKRLFESLKDIAEKQLQLEEVELYMEELGARHITYQAPPELIRGVTPYILKCIEENLGEDWNTVVEDQMRLFFDFLTGGLIMGMDVGKNKGENRKAPDGQAPFCILFTDVESSTDLWQLDPVVMSEAVKEHHRIIRTLIAQYGAYEVKTAGDSFIIAANDVLVGLKIAIGIQLEFMRQAPITPGFKMLPKVQGGGDASCWRDNTLRVRIGIEYCTDATATYDTVHRRYDYYGPSINECARIEAAAAGGQILMSRATFRALKNIKAFSSEPCPSTLRSLDETTPEDERGFDQFIAMRDVGKLKLKGIKKPVHLASLVPMCLAGRQFKDFDDVAST